ncbi:MAG: DNA-processing protein DprA [Pseudomonadota bacterium]|nr:DNA-processing protein DprA [Pseudomonadota bacterium]
MIPQQITCEQAYWLALARAPGVGPITFARLLQHFGHPQAVLTAHVHQWQQLGLKGELVHYLQQPDWHAVEKDLAWLAQPKNHLLTWQHPQYPARLRDIHDPPPVLFVHGDCTLLGSAQLAMVGTRNPSRDGERTAFEFAHYLSETQLTITSGLALGIDAASHRGALQDKGYTIAIAGTGLDRVYPAQHRQLAHQIAETGALVSEFPPGTPPRASHFPRRNRIISGLTLGTLVVEAPLHSGALYTAQQAIEQGREVFAVPGSIHNPLVKGCHKLIKEGAKLVETAADIIEDLWIQVPATTQLLKEYAQEALLTQTPTHTQETLELEDEYGQLLKHLCGQPTSVDHLVELSGLTAEAVSSMLLILELRGLVTAQAGGLYTRLS